MKCNFCEAEINEDMERCSNCNKTNENYIPKTIEDLKVWYINRNLPDENITRFFIGKNYKEPKAFGIYKDESTNNFCVYKNKADGTRAVRYEGPDESFAVKELYLRLKEEIYNQKANNTNPINNNSSGIVSKRTHFNWFIAAILALIIVPSLISIIARFSSPSRGYYHYNDNYYYYQNGDWYRYSNGWYLTDVPSVLRDNYDDYYSSYGYDYKYNIFNFENSDYYVEPSSDSYSSSSSDWDSGSSWDSSSTDWDSDW